MPKMSAKERRFRKATKLWEILSLALIDLRACERDKEKFEIDMHEWFVPGKKCIVCLAGSVIAQRFACRSKDEFEELCDADADIDAKIDAINFLRRGNVEYALLRVGRSGRPYLNRPMPEYGDPQWWDPQWWPAMRKLLRDLKEADL